MKIKLRKPARHHWLIAVGAFVVGYFANGLMTNPPLTSSELAGWAQAFGSLFAVYAVFKISRDDQVRIEKRERGINIRSAARAADTVNNVTKSVIIFAKLIEERSDQLTASAIDNFRLLRESVEQSEIDLSDWELEETMRAVKYGLDALIRLCETTIATRSEGNYGKFHAQYWMIGPRCQEIARSADKARSTLSSYIGELRGYERIDHS